MDIWDANVFTEKYIERDVSSYNNDVCTLPKTNMSPEKWWLEDEMSFWDVVPFLGDMFNFQGRYV